MNRIAEIYEAFPYYGYRKIHAVLCQEGHRINHKKVQRLMQEMGIKALYPGPQTSTAHKENRPYPYLLKGLDIIRPNQVWAIDLTYVRLPVGMTYLFALIDWYSRYIVGWHLAHTMECYHAIETFERALSLGTPDICNADQGSQFTGRLWVDKLQSCNVQISHDGKGRCIDNVRIERFWRTLKYEDIYLQSYQTLHHARQGIAAFIDHYNHHRPHQALGYDCPAQWFKHQL